MKEISYGVIAIKILQGKPAVLLVRHVKNGFWGFPKGHAEPGETPHEAAARELLEETGLRVTKVLHAKPFHERYIYLKDETPIEKEVYFYLCQAEGELRVCKKEILEGRFVDLENAYHQITYQEGKKLVKEVIEVMSSLALHKLL